MGALVKQKELLEVTGYKNGGKPLEDVLSEQGIRFFYGKGGQIWTTTDLINAAGGLAQVQSDNLKAEDIV